MIGLSRLKELVEYNPETGVFTNRIHSRNRTKGRTLGCRTKAGYLHAKIDGKIYKLHRLAWFYVHGYWPPETVDHINQDKTDNRIANLRLATWGENTRYRKLSSSREGYRGVRSARNGKFEARIMTENIRESLGYFDTAEEAAKAYSEAAKKYHKEFAITNE